MSFVWFIVIFSMLRYSSLVAGETETLLPPRNTIFQDIAELGVNFIENALLLDSTKNNDPALKMTTPEMIRNEGYPAESHEVTTSDGYVLTLHRIPGQPGAPAVFMQHGLLGSSFDWVLAGKYHSLPFLLADQGYDVWLGNSRGNTYSRKHVSLPTDSLKYWSFSWHEMGVYDLPASIGYISNLKQNDSLIYVGHSQGTTQFFVLATERPNFTAEKIRASFVLSPVVFMSNIKSPLRLLAKEPFRSEIEFFFRVWSHGEVLPHSWIVKFFAKYGCDITVVEKEICANMLFALCGFDNSQFNFTLLPRILSDYPAGSSVQSIVHYAQEIESGRFQKYDYGTKGNIERYHQKNPPDYNLSKIKVPIALFWGENDWLSSTSDVQKLSTMLPTAILNYKVDYPKFNHLDFLWAIDARKLVYNKMISVMEKFKWYN